MAAAVHPSRPQPSEPLRTPADLLELSRREPVWWAKSVLGVDFWSRQRHILRSVQRNRRTAVRSARGVGKTRTAAVAALWWLFTMEDARVVTTATTQAQVRDVLWREIGRLHRMSRFPLGGQLTTMRLELPGERFAVGLTSRPENREAFQGVHSKHVLFIADEASGVDEQVYDACEGMLTTEGSRWLCIGNPIRLEGTFHRAFHGERDQWNRMHVSAFDTPTYTGEECSPRVTAAFDGMRQWVEERRQAIEGTPMWDVDVLGQFPTQSEDGVMSLAEVEAAQDLTPEPGSPVVIGVDVARYGSDETVVALRRGDLVTFEWVAHERSTMDVAGHVKRLHDSLLPDAPEPPPVPTRRRSRALMPERAEPPSRRPTVVVDDDGVGGGVTDRLREQGVKVIAYNAGGKALRSDLYPNRRSESWFTLGERLEEGLALPRDDRLGAELVTAAYKLDSQGRRVVEPKNEMRKRLGRSPDRADAVMLTLADRAGIAQSGRIHIW